MNPLRIGSVIFWTAECPEEMPIGGVSQMEVTHQLPGGTRIVQTFGPDPEAVSWTGTFWPPNITTRVQQLRLYAVNAVRVALNWKGEQYTCVITKFQPRQRAAYCDYEIDLVVVADNNGAFTLSSPTSIDAQINALLSQALIANTQISLPPLATLNAPVPSISTSAAKSAAAGYAFQPALTNLQAVIQSAGPLAANITTAGPQIAAAATAASTGIAAYIATLGGSDPNYASAALLQASVTAIGLNAARGQNVNQLVTQGTSLFATAAQHYGDITQAFALAEANGLPSPFLSAQSPTTIKLPPFVTGT